MTHGPDPDTVTLGNPRSLTFKLKTYYRAASMTIRCCAAALLLLATSAIAEAVTYASIEAQHAATAATLQASPDAGRALGQIGVARVDGVVDASRCAALRTRIYDLLATLDDDDGPRDMRFVAGTRLRLGDAMRATFAGPRSDVLLPCEDATVWHVLSEALAALLPSCEAAAPRSSRSSSWGD